MSTNEFWDRLCEMSDRLEAGTRLVTPVSDRPFEVETAAGHRIEIRFLDSGEERSLHREQFAVLSEHLEDGPLTLETLPPAVEPYAVVLSLSPEHVSDGDTLTRSPEEAVTGESPHLLSPEEARTRPERVHDDAILLADVLERHDVEEPVSLDTESLTDLYVLLSDVQRGADRVRREVRDPLLGRLGPGQQLHGRFGTVRRTTRERRRPKDEEAILSALDDQDIPHEWVLGIDPDKLDVVLAVTDLDEADVYDVEEQVYAQKTGVDEGEKFSRLQGLADRLEEVEDGEELREDLLDLEARIEEALSAD